MCTVSGVSYMFSAIAPSLKEQLDFTQYEINMVGTMANVGGNLAVLGSLFYNFAGTRPSCLLAGFLMFLGYFLIYCGAVKWISVNFVVMGMFFMVMQNGASTAYTAALSTNIVNFSHASRGRVVGAMASFLAISAAIFTSIFSIVFKRDLNQFLLFMAISAGGIPIVSTIFMNIVPQEGGMGELCSDDEGKSLNIQGFTQPLKSDSTSDSDLEVSQPVLYYQSNSNGTEVSPFVATEHPELAVIQREGSERSTQKIVTTKDMVFREVNPIQVLFTLDFWLLFIVFFSGVGSVYVINNNLGSIVLSLGAKKGSQNVMILLFSFSNCVGRIIAGWVSDKLARHVTRMTLLNCASLCIGLVHYGFSFSTLRMMYPLVTCLGFMNGALYAMIPSYLSERFGQKYFSITFRVACLAPSLGSYLLATLLASAIYKANSKEGSKSCYGKECYQATYLICTGLCLLGFIVGLVLMYRSRKMYNRIRAYNQRTSSKS